MIIDLATQVLERQSYLEIIFENILDVSWLVRLNFPLELAEISFQKITFPERVMITQ